MATLLVSSRERLVKVECCSNLILVRDSLQMEPDEEECGSDDCQCIPKISTGRIVLCRTMNDAWLDQALS